VLRVELEPLAVLPVLHVEDGGRQGARVEPDFQEVLTHRQPEPAGVPHLEGTGRLAQQLVVEDDGLATAQRLEEDQLAAHDAGGYVAGHRAEPAAAEGVDLWPAGPRVLEAVHHHAAVRPVAPGPQHLAHLQGGLGPVCAHGHDVVEADSLQLSVPGGVEAAQHPGLRRLRPDLVELDHRAPSPTFARRGQGLLQAALVEGEQLLQVGERGQGLLAARLAPSGLPVAQGCDAEGDALRVEPVPDPLEAEAAHLDRGAQHIGEAPGRNGHGRH
jgi:hypothetical protein